MLQLKWTDQDMINFASQYSEYDIAEMQLEDWKEQVKQQVINMRVKELVSKLTDNPELFEQIESIINSQK